MENLNIYSEPLFNSPSTQGSTPSLSSLTVASQSTQSQSSGESGSKSASLPKDEKDLENDKLHKGFDADEEGEEQFSLEKIVVPAFTLDQEQTFCTTGCLVIDDFFKGGIPTAGLTELYGEGGTGKTQFCLQLAVTAQLPEAEGGLDSGVFFICTEGQFPTIRITEMISNSEKLSKAKVNLDTLMNNIYIENVNDMEELAQCVEVKLPMLARQQTAKMIRMVILDSVAGVFRFEYDDLTRRTYEMRQLAQNLHEYSLDHKAAIVVCNQVTSSLELETNIAALGLAWKNMMSTRILLSKNDASRKLEVEFSPYIPANKLPFQITAEGVSSSTR